MTIISLALGAENLTQSSNKADIRRLLQPFGGINFLAEQNATACLYLGEIWPAPPQLGLNPLPELVQIVAELLQEAQVRQISVAARAAAGFSWADALRLSGYEALPGLEFINLAEAACLERASELNLAAEYLTVPEILLHSNCLINIAKLRVAEGQLLGAALLNLQAVVDLPDDEEQKTRVLVDLYSIIQPDLHLVDCWRGTKGLQPQQQSLLLAGSDAVALDLVTATVAGLAAEDLEYLALAAQYDLGCAQAGDIHVVGEGLAELFGLPDDAPNNAEEE
jgi:uncharacterized protein (DUF362 family)